MAEDRPGARRATGPAPFIGTGPAVTLSRG
jgi:hypothetical protein